MIKSMTGFGKAVLNTKNGFIDIEIRSVNHKYLEISSKLPNGFSLLEDKIREYLQKRIRRGKVHLSLIYETKKTKDKEVLIDENLADDYAKSIRKLKNDLKLKGDIEVKDIINLPGIVSYKEVKKDYLKIWNSMEKVLGLAANDLDKEKIKEGIQLKKELLKRISYIDEALKEITKRSFLNIDSYKTRLANTIKELSKSQDFDKNRMELEVALFAKNCDITEEITRLKSHLMGLKGLLNSSGEEAGKKLDFISQELNREINTIGSKSSDFKISQKVIIIKSEIEKIREQAKNIE